MNGQPSIKKNYIFNLISQVVSFLIPLIVTPYISRIFQADGIGINSFTTANVTYFTLFSMLGISGYGQREIAICRDNRQKTSEIFCELQFIHLITFLVTAAAYLFFLFFSKDYRVYYIAQSVTLLSCFLDINWFYQAYERFGFIAARNCIIKILMLFGTFLLIHQKEDLILYILLVAVANLLSNLSLWLRLKEFIDFIPLKDLHPRRHLKEIFVFFIPTIAASVYSILDKSVINLITHEESENGYYEQAYRILTVANVVVQSLSGVAAPRMAYVFSENRMEEFKEKLGNAMEFMLLIAVPVACGIAAIAPRFVPLFFGDGFDKTIRILYIFSPLVVVLGFSVYLDGMYLVPAGRRAESARIICMGAVLNLFLNFLLVLKAKSIGAAAATLITEGFIATRMVYLSKDMIDGKKIFRCFAKYGFFSVTMFFVVRGMSYWILDDLTCVAVQIFGGMMLYGFLLIAFRDRITMDTICGFGKRLKIFQHR